MLSGSDIAEESSAWGCCDSAADSRSDVIVSGSDISNERSQNIEWSAHADRLLDLHVCFDLVHRHVAGAFHHYLNVLCPCALSKLTESYELFDLAYIARVSKTARTASVAQWDRDVVLSADIEDLIVVFVERILVACHAHPREDQWAASWYDIHLSLMLLDLVDRVPCDAAVKSDKIDAVFSVKSYDIDKIFCS